MRHHLGFRHTIAWTKRLQIGRRRFLQTDGQGSVRAAVVVPLDRDRCGAVDRAGEAEGGNLYIWHPVHRGGACTASGWIEPEGVPPCERLPGGELAIEWHVGVGRVGDPAADVEAFTRRRYASAVHPHQHSRTSTKVGIDRAAQVQGDGRKVGLAHREGAVETRAGAYHILRWVALEADLSPVNGPAGALWWAHEAHPQMRAV